MASSRRPVHRSASTLQPSRPPPPTPERGRVLDSLVRRILSAGEGRLRVGVDGLTAAGKSTLGDELAERLGRAGRPVLRASLDDFKKPWRDRHLYDRESGEGYYRNAYDYGAVVALLLGPAAPGGSGRCALCSIDPLTQVDHSATTVVAAPDVVLVVDGIFAFRPVIDDHWDVRVWVDVPATVSFERGVLRDRGWAGAASESLHRDRYAVAEQVYLAEVDPVRRADVVVDNGDPDRPRLLRT